MISCNEKFEKSIQLKTQYIDKLSVELTSLEPSLLDLDNRLCTLENSISLVISIYEDLINRLYK